MINRDQLAEVIGEWRTVVGSNPVLGEELTGRELWRVTATDGRRYFLKRLGPWRNLPPADEARVLRWLSVNGVDVAEFMITDRATVYAGAVEDCYVLIPAIVAHSLSPAEVLAGEEPVGRAIAGLHRALGRYPWSANSYTEQLGTALSGELLLPDDVAAGFRTRRDGIIAAIEGLPLQLVHGDLTPANILLCRPGAVAGFIDFDHLPYAPRVWDLAKYLSRRLRRRWLEGEQQPTGRVDSIGPVLRGYHRHSPLTDSEREALPAIILAANVIEASYAQRIASGLLQRRMLPDHHLELADAVDAARWQLTHDDAVVEAVRRS